MTDTEMRRRLAEAMGWTMLEWHPAWSGRRDDGTTWSAPGFMAGQYPGTTGLGGDSGVPDPLEDDEDAALLRAWCVAPEQGGLVQIDCDADDTEVLVWLDSGYAVATVTSTEEPDPCRRERLALCRAVFQALEVRP